MEKLRDVSQAEIHRAAQCWARQQRSNPNAHSYDNSASFFIYAAKKWLCFHGRLKPSSAPRTRFADQLGDFAFYMTRRTRAVSAVRPITLPEDVEVPELGWERHRLLARVSVADVDEFLAMKGAAGWNRKSVSVAAQALRLSSGRRETRGWCAAGFAKGIQAPSINMRTCPKVPPRKRCDSSCNR